MLPLLASCAPYSAQERPSPQPYKLTYTQLLCYILLYESTAASP